MVSNNSVKQSGSTRITAAILIIAASAYVTMPASAAPIAPRRAFNQTRTGMKSVASEKE
jgi:hypothetical protein